MHGRKRPPRACQSGKVRYPDHHAAVAALHTIASRSTREVKASRAYECPTCKGWHLTSRALRG